MPGQLATTIRAKYPGAYDDLDDAALESQVLAKYPQYKDLAEPAKPEPTTQIAEPSFLGDFASGLMAPITGTLNAIAHPIEAGRQIVANINRGVSPDAGAQIAAEPRRSLGENLGTAATTIFGPRLVTKAAAKVPSALVKTGEVVERGGAAMNPATGAVVGSLVSGGPVGAAVGMAAPSVMRGTGRLMQRTGRALDRGATPPRVAPLAAEVEAAAPIAEPGPMLGPAPKPRWTAQETAANLRDMHGSEQAGKMLYGPVQRGSGPGSAVSSAAARKGAIKTLTPNSATKLPSAPKGELDARMAGATSEDAFAYAQKAPNQIAEKYFGDRLIDQLPRNADIQEAAVRAMLMDMMKAR